VKKKYERAVSLPGEVGNSFENEDYVLTYKPVIEYVAPETIELDDGIQAAVPRTIEGVRQETEDLIEGYRAIKELSEIAQQRIDQRVEAAGGLTIHLDPKADSSVIAAMKRRFPDGDPTKITYDQYRDCLDAQRRNQVDLPLVSATDIQNAKADPFRTDFGGLGNLAGMNRAEIASPAQVVEPIDITSFQTTVVKQLFEMLTPMIKDLILKVVNPF